jgi:hypothetical protein
VNRYDVSTALLALVEKTIESVEGYGEKFMKLPNGRAAALRP